MAQSFFSLSLNSASGHRAGGKSTNVRARNMFTVTYQNHTLFGKVESVVLLEFISHGCADEDSSPLVYEAT